MSVTSSSRVAAAGGRSVLRSASELGQALRQHAMDGEIPQTLKTLREFNTRRINITLRSYDEVIHLFSTKDEPDLAARYLEDCLSEAKKIAQKAGVAIPPSLANDSTTPSSSSNQPSDATAQSATTQSKVKNKNLSWQVQPDLFKYVIDAYSRKSNSDQAIYWLNRMKESSVPPSIHMYGAVAHSYALNGDSSGAQAWIDRMKEENVMPNTIIWNSLINSYAKCADAAGAERVLKDMIQSGVETNATSWNAAINAVSQAGDLQAADRLFCEMKASGVNADVVTFSSVIRAASMKGLTSEATKWLERMVDEQITPNGISFNTILGAFGNKKGDLFNSEPDMVRKLTMKWLAAMKSKGVEPDIRTMKAAVGNNPVSSSLESELVEGEDNFSLESFEIFPRSNADSSSRPQESSNSQMPHCSQASSSSSAPARSSTASTSATSSGRNHASEQPAKSHQNVLSGTQKEWRRRFLELNDDRCKAILHQLRSRGMETSVLMLSDHAALLDKYARNGEARAAAVWLDEMYEAKVVPDAICLKAVLAAFDRQAEIKQQKELPAGDDDQRTACAGHRVVLRSFMRFGDGIGAKNFLTSMTVTPDVDCYIYVMQAFLSQGQTNNAGQVLELMKAAKIQPNVKCYLSLISALAMKGDISRALVWFKRYQESNLYVSGRAYESLIAMYSKKGDFKRATKYFHLMQSQGLDATVEMYTGLIYAHTQANNAAGAKVLFEEMLRNRIEPDVVAFNALIGNAAKIGDASTAVDWLNRMRDEHVAPNRISYNSIVSACARGGDLKLATQYMDKMSQEGMQPNLRTFNAIIYSSVLSGDGDQAVKWVRQMKKMGLKPDVISYNSCIDAYSSRADAKNAKIWFSVMNDEKLVADRFSYSSVIDAHAQIGDATGAENWLKLMAGSKVVRPDTFCFGAVIYAYAHAGDLENAKIWLDRMDKGRPFKNNTNFTRLLQGNERAEQMLQDMSMDQVGVSQASCEKAVAKAVGSSDLLGAMVCLARMESFGKSPNIATLSILLEGFRKRGSDVATQKFWGSLRHAGVSPTVAVYNAAVASIRGEIKRASSSNQPKDPATVPTQHEEAPPAAPRVEKDAETENDTGLTVLIPEDDADF